MILKPVDDNIDLSAKKPRGKVYRLIESFQSSGVRAVEVQNDGSYSTSQSMYTSLWMCIKNNYLDREGISLKMVDGNIYLVNDRVEH